MIYFCFLYGFTATSIFLVFRNRHPLHVRNDLWEDILIGCFWPLYLWFRVLVKFAEWAE